MGQYFNGWPATSTANLVHAFVTARFNYCFTLCACLPAVILGCLEQIVRTVARIHRTGHISCNMLDVLYWLPFQLRIIFLIAALIWRCMLALLRPTCTYEISDVTPRAQEVAAPSAQWNGGRPSLCPFCPYLHKADPMHSRWLASLCGIGFNWHCAFSPGFIFT